VIIDRRVGHAFPNLSLSRLKYREIYRCVKPREWGTRVLEDRMTVFVCMRSVAGSLARQ
jgi:hypothetical protein